MKKLFQILFGLVLSLPLCAFCLEKPSFDSRSILPETDSGNVPESPAKPAPVEAPENVRFKTLEGLVMAGYQGWFNTPADGAGLGWKHWQKQGKFEPGMCTIDLWPDMSEYEISYPTAFRHADGSVARVFSPRDKSTVDVHFKWMQQYGIDGAFMQRFVTSLRTPAVRANYEVILMNAVEAAEKFDRAISVMYDLSGMKPGEQQIVKEDWIRLNEVYKLTSRENNHYLHHNGRPLVCLWGIGFSGKNRKYGLDEAQDLIDFFREQGCSILLGVPSRFHLLNNDTVSDPRAHEIFRQADVLHPWFVGRYDIDSYDKFAREIIPAQIKWCKKNKVDYIPVCYPGFSWHNMKPDTPFAKIPRHGGRFFWKQLKTVVGYGAKSIYISMFDEVDEGTAIFKCTNTPPVGQNGEQLFIDYEGLPSDHYLWLSGMGAKLLRGEIKPTEELPFRK